MKKILTILSVLLLAASVFGQEPRFSSRQNKDWSEAVDDSIAAYDADLTSIEGDVSTLEGRADSIAGAYADIDTLQNYTEGVFNVKDYGAVGDSVTDDTQAFKDAIAAADVDGGGIVYIPSGKYIIEDTLMLKSNVRILGGGVNTILYGNALMFYVPYNETNYWEISNLTINQMSDPAIQIDSISAHWLIDNVLFYKWTASDPIFLAIEPTSTLLNGHITNCHFEMYLESTAPIIRWNGTGSINMNTIENSWFQANFNQTVPFIVLTDSSNSYNYTNVFRNLTFETCKAGAMELKSCKGTVIDNCWVYDLSGTTTGSMFLFDRTEVGDAASQNNVIMNSGRIGAVTLGADCYDIEFTGYGTFNTASNCFAQGSPTLSMANWSYSNSVIGGSVSIDDGVTGLHIDAFNGTIIHETVDIGGDVDIGGNLTVTGTYPSDYIWDEPLPDFNEYILEAKKNNRLPLTNDIDRSNVMKYIGALEGEIERLYMYIEQLMPDQ